MLEIHLVYYSPCTLLSQSKMRARSFLSRRRSTLNRELLSYAFSKVTSTCHQRESTNGGILNAKEEVYCLLRGLERQINNDAVAHGSSCYRWIDLSAGGWLQWCINTITYCISSVTISTISRNYTSHKYGANR